MHRHPLPPAPVRWSQQLHVAITATEAVIPPSCVSEKEQTLVGGGGAGGAMPTLFWDEINISSILHTLTFCKVHDEKHYFGSNYCPKLKFSALGPPGTSHKHRVATTATCKPETVQFCLKRCQYTISTATTTSTGRQSNMNNWEKD